MCVVEHDERWAERLGREARGTVMEVICRRERIQREKQNEEAGRTS
jgi:hypothetical protein